MELQCSEMLSGHSFDRILLSPERTSSIDVFLRHKTTCRELHERELARARDEGFDEVIFANEKGQLTEGAISNIFIEQNGRLFTPPVRCGVLPRICRRRILNPGAQEKVLMLDDLKHADAVLLCNSVRGLHRAASFSLDCEIRCASK